MTESTQRPIAVIAGVGPGLGASLARRFAKEYAVAINARSAAYLHSLAAEIRKAGGVAVEMQADLGNHEQVKAAFKLVRERLGEPDVLLYSAGAGPFGNVTEVTPEQFENSLRINALGAFVCAKECAPGMIARGHGVMLFTGATAGIKAGAKPAAFGPGELRQARASSIAGARSRPQGHPCCVD